MGAISKSITPMGRSYQWHAHASLMRLKEGQQSRLIPDFDA